MRSHSLITFFLLLAPVLAATAQTRPGYGWSSYGVLPFHGYDFVIVKAPTRYVLYYTKHPTGTLAEGGAIVRGRAFSTDLKTWTEDTTDVCATSGDYCYGVRTGALTLPDGRMRMYINPDAQNLASSISSDGVTWVREPGVRLSVDSSNIYERGNFSLELTTFVTLPDGSIRMYYEGGITPGSAGTPAWYNNNNSFNGVLLKPTGAILSAISKDNGLTWAKETGLRINPLVQGPANTILYNDFVTRTEIDATDLTAITTTENGKAVFRLYVSSWDGTVGYVSSDGLNFSLEGLVPADRGDPKAIALPDGRIWMVTNQYPEAINDTIVYGPQSFAIGSVKADVTLPPAPDFAPYKYNHFNSVAMGITGTSNGPVTLELTAVANASGCQQSICGSHPEYYSFNPPSGTPPFTTVLSYTGPTTYTAEQLIVHAKSKDATAVAMVYCTNASMDRSDSSIFCKSSDANLPRNQMTFAFSPGAAPSSQTNSILATGGPGYPFATGSSVSWATVSPANGTAPAPLTVTVNPAGLAPGSYTGIITVLAESVTQNITVTAVVSAGPVITGIQNAGSSNTTVTPNSFISIYGSGFTATPAGWNPTTSLPTTLGGVSVQINGKSAYISYAGPSQINILAPPDTTTGTVPVTVTTQNGTVSSTVTLAPSSPAWFTYSVNGFNSIAALFGNTSIYVAPTGTFQTVTSRPAAAGDYLQLYVNGLGNTTPAAPAGVVLGGSYPLDDLSRLTITMGGQTIPVLYAGMTGAGLYQINVQVPPGLASGNQPVVLFVDGQPSQGATVNFK